MKQIKTYHTNRFLALVVTIMGFALLFTIDIDRLIVFYRDPLSIIVVGFFGLVSPLLIFFGFSLKILPNEVVSKSYFFFEKRFKISDLSHVLYQSTWHGVAPVSSKTSMRSLHIVRRSGGWMDTISLANGPYKEEDLAHIAKELQQINPKIQFDEYAHELIKRYEV